MYDVVVGALELAPERAPKRLDAAADIATWNGHAQNARLTEALDVRLFTAAQNQRVDAVPTGESAQNLPQLNTGAVRTGQAAESDYERTGHEEGACRESLKWQD